MSGHAAILAVALLATGAQIAVAQPHAIYSRAEAEAIDASGEGYLVRAEYEGRFSHGLIVYLAGRDALLYRSHDSAASYTFYTSVPGLRSTADLGRGNWPLWELLESERPPDSPPVALESAVGSSSGTSSLNSVISAVAAFVGVVVVLLAVAVVVRVVHSVWPSPPYRPTTYAYIPPPRPVQPQVQRPVYQPAPPDPREEYLARLAAQRDALQRQVGAKAQQLAQLKKGGRCV